MKNRCTLYVCFLLISLSAFAQSPPDVLFKIRHEDKFGLIDSTGRVVIAPRFDAIFPIYASETVRKTFDKLMYGSSSYRRHDSYYNVGEFNRGTDVLFAQRIDEDKFIFPEGLAIFRKGDLHGYINQQGEIVIDAQYVDVLPFSEGLAAVCMPPDHPQAYKYGFINPQNELVIAPQFSKVESFKDGQAKAWDQKQEVHIVTSNKEAQPFVMKRLPIPKKDHYNQYLNEHLRLSGYEHNLHFYHTKERKSYPLPLAYEKGYGSNKGTALVLKDRKWSLIDTTGRVHLERAFCEVLPFVTKTQIAPVKRDSLWALVNAKGEAITDFRFKKIISTPVMGGAFFKAYDRDKEVLIDTTGKVVLVCEKVYPWVSYDYLLPQIRVQNLAKKWGAIDHKLKEVLPFHFDALELCYGHTFHFAALKDSTGHLKWGLIDSLGDFLHPPVWDTLPKLLTPHYKLMKVRQNGKYGLVDTTGQLVLSSTFDQLPDYFSHYEDRKTVKKDGKVGVINQDGNILVPPTDGYDEFRMQYYDALIKARKDTQWGCLNEQNKMVIPFEYSYIQGFQHKKNVWVVQQKNADDTTRYGLYLCSPDLDTCQLAIPIQYDNIWLLGADLSIIVLELDQQLYVRHVKNDLIISPPINISNSPFSKRDRLDLNFQNGLAHVRQERKFGFLNTHFELATPIHFTKATDFQNGLAQVYLPGKHVFIDTTGQILNTRLEWVGFDRAGKYGIIDSSGKKGIVRLSDGTQVLSCEYDRIERYGAQNNICNFSCRTGFHRIYKNQKVGLLNQNGVVVVPCEYDELDHAYTNNDRTHFVFKVIKNDKIGLWSAQSRNQTCELGFPAEMDSIVINDFDLEEYGFIKVFKNGKAGMWQQGSGVFIPPIYEDIFNLFYHYFKIKVRSKFGALVRDPDTGLVSTIVPPLYDEIKYFDNDFYAILKGKSGTLNEPNGNLGPNFKPFPKEKKNKPTPKTIHKNWTILEKKGRKGIANKNGKKIIRPKYDQITPLGKHLFQLTIDDKTGLADTTGTIVVPVEYDELQWQGYELCWAKKGEYWGLVQFANRNQKATIRHPFYFTRIDELYPPQKYWQTVRTKDTRYQINVQTGHVLQPDCCADPRELSSQYLAYYDKQRCKWGIYDGFTGKIVQKPSYHDIKILYPQTLAFEVEGKWGLMDAISLDTIQSPLFDKINFNRSQKETQRFFSVVIEDSTATQSHRSGMINGEGEVILPVIFDKGQILKREKGEGYFNVFIDGQYQRIDTTGKVLWTKPFSEKLSYDKYKLARVKIDNKWGWVNKMDSLVIPAIFEEVSYKFTKKQCVSCMALGKTAKGWQGILPDGTLQAYTPPPVPMQTNNLSNTKGIQKIEANGKWGIQNGFTNTILIAPKYDDVRVFQNGIFAFKMNDLWGYADTLGQVIFEPQFGTYQDISKGSALAYSPDRKQGFIDNKGNILLPPIYDAISFNQERGYYELKKNGKVGIIDSAFQSIISPIYERIELYTNNKILLKNGWFKFFDDEKMGLLNAKGEIVLSVPYEDYEPLSAHIAAAKTDGKWGILNTNTNEWIVSPIFDELKKTSDSHYRLFLPSKFAYLSTDLEYVWEEAGFEYLK